MNNINQKSGIMRFSEVIYEALKADGLGDYEIEHFFDGYKKDDIYKYFSDEKIKKILRSVNMTHFIVDDVQKSIKFFLTGEKDIVNDNYITYTNILFFFFYIVKTRPELNNADFIKALYIAADHNFDLLSYKDVKDAILYNTIRSKKEFDFWKSEMEYWEKHKNEYTPNLQLPIVNDKNSSIAITDNYERQKRLSEAEKLLLENSITGNYERERRLSDKKISTKRTALLYNQWTRRLVKGMDIEDNQKTRMSINLINREIEEWDGFEPDYTEEERLESNKLKTKKMIELVLDSGNRRVYYFNKLVNDIIKAQEHCEDKDFIKDYLVCIDVEGKESNEIYKCLKIDGLLRLLNTIFDGVSDLEKNALGNFSERVGAFCSQHLLTDKEQNDLIAKGLYRPETVGVEDPFRRRRKYIYAYIVGEYQAKNEKDKEVSVSKELLLMMVLVLKAISPEMYSLGDVENMIFNSRYGRTIGNTLFECFFINTFKEIHENGESLSLRERFVFVQEQSAKYEILFLRKGKTPFADAILNKETVDGKDGK